MVHFRNLPFEVAADEIRQFCTPWGAVVAVKDKVGGMKNQAFVEFAALEQAIAIVSHYQHAAEPAQFRGRPSWLSFSGRDQLTNVQPGSDTATPVLQVALGHIPADLAPAVNLDLLNALFSSYGFVKKLVTLSKPEGGMLAWVQFQDAAVAAQVGRCCWPSCWVAT